jgi:predicted ATPase
MRAVENVKIVTISGPQGCGKGSMIAAVEKLNFDAGQHVFYYDPFKVSRSVQEKLGYATLQEATSTFEKMVEFQDLILEEKKSSLLELKKYVRTSIIMTERSFIDIAAYFELWLVKQGQDTSQSWVQKYFEKCYEFQNEIVEECVIIPMMAHVQPQIDVRRADFADVDAFYEMFIRHLSISGAKARFITEETIQGRANQFVSFYGEF